MHQHRFPNITLYQEWKRARRFRFRMTFWVIGFLGFSWPWVWHAFHPPLKATDRGAGVTYTYIGNSVGIIFPASSPIQDEPGTGTSFLEADRALDTAVAAWRFALHDPSLEKPRLKPGFCSDLAATACVARGGNEIEFAARLKRSDGTYVDLPTVMMHEVAHILGVPHIEGDPLMDPVYQGKLAGPSLNAIAIAKAHREK